MSKKTVFLSSAVVAAVATYAYATSGWVVPGGRGETVPTYYPSKDLPVEQWARTYDPAKSGTVCECDKVRLDVSGKTYCSQPMRPVVVAECVAK